LPRVRREGGAHSIARDRGNLFDREGIPVDHHFIDHARNVDALNP